MESWLFLEIATKGLQISDWVNISTFLVSASGPLNIFKQDSSLFSITSSSISSNFTFELAYTFRPSMYKLEIPVNLRFMTGWKLEGSNNNSTFTELYSIETDLCTIIKNNQFCSRDCGSLTIRTFSCSPGVFKYYRFSMVKPDSCGTYDLALSKFDLFGIIDYKEPRQCSCICYIPFSYNYTIIIISFFLTIITL